MTLASRFTVKLTLQITKPKEDDFNAPFGKVTIRDQIFQDNADSIKTTSLQIPCHFLQL